jgi:hypothetical protein
MAPGDELELLRSFVDGAPAPDGGEWMRSLVRKDGAWYGRVGGLDGPLGADARLGPFESERCALMEIADRLLAYLALISRGERAP